jgi:hypothetical protein
MVVSARLFPAHDDNNYPDRWPSASLIMNHPPSPDRRHQLSPPKCVAKTQTVRNHLLEGCRACARALSLSLSLSLSPTLPSPVRRLFLSCLFISYHLGSVQLLALALPEPSAPACLPACLPPPHRCYYYFRCSQGYHHYCIIIIMTQILLFPGTVFLSQGPVAPARVCLVGRVHRGPVVIFTASSSTVHGPGWNIAHGNVFGLMV